MSTLTIHTHTAGESGLFVNSYIVETANGLVVVDTNLLNSDIATLVERVRALGKPLAGVFVTHPHPDHFNGVHALVAERDVPVYATAAVAGVITEIADAKRAQWKPVYGDEWPQVTTYPTVLLGDARRVEIDGVAYSAYDVGPAESHADSYILARAAEGGEAGATVAFIGDLAFDGTHPYTADGHSGLWLDALRQLPAELAVADQLLPGHGSPSGIALLTAQREHLVRYRDEVRRLADGRPALDEDAKAQLGHVMRAYAPGARLDWMIGLGADAVAAELAAER